MQKSTFSKIALTISAGFICALSFSLKAENAQAKTLNGSASETDTIQGPAGLTREDINKNSDPFGKGGGQPKEQTFDPSASSFDFGGSAPPPPKQPLRGNAQDGGNPNFQNGTPGMGQFQNGVPEQTAMATQQPMQQAGARQADQNEEPELKLQWDAWHKNVALTIYQRFSTLSNRFFAHGQPLRAVVAYSVTRDGKIVNAHLTQKSPNIIYNTMVLTVVNSINGDVGVLAFPQGSRRMSVEKSGDFTVNWGPQEGFKYTTGDDETVRLQKQQQQQLQQQQQQQRR